MNQQTSTIFWNNVTEVDCAIKFPWYPMPVGYSFQVAASVSGAVSEDEAVVVDFGTGKKALKAFIDGEKGPDHKLILSKDSARALQLSLIGHKVKDIKNVRLPLSIEAFTEKDSYVNPIRGTLPEDAVYYYEGDMSPKYNFIESCMSVAIGVCRDLSKAASEELGFTVNLVPMGIMSTVMPEFLQQLAKDFTDKYTDSPMKVSPFHYTHGLPNSTSYGCQNPIHGHLSHLALFVPRRYHSIPEVQQAIEEFFNSLTHAPLMFINKHEISSYSFEGNYLAVSFNTRSRGKHVLEMFNTNPTKYAIASSSGYLDVIPIDGDSTVENLVESLAGSLTKLLDGNECPFCLIVTEGLSKGAVYTNW